MAEESAPAAPAELQTLLEERQNDLKQARSSGWLAGMVKTVGGAAAGMIVGVVGAVGAATIAVMDSVRSSHGRFKQFAEKYDKLPVEAQQKMMNQLMEDTTRNVRAGGSISAAIVRNPGTFIAVTTLVGAGGMLLGHEDGKKKERQKIERDITALERIADSWQDRTTQTDETKKDCGCRK